MCREIIAGLLLFFASAVSSGNQITHNIPYFELRNNFRLSPLIGSWPGSSAGWRPPLATSNRIVGGSPATIEQFPWTVSMQYHGKHRCGGAIIAPTVILTAAHCTNELLLGRIPASQLSVRAGSTSSVYGGQIAQVVDFRQHPQYNNDNFHNDLCLMWLNAVLDTKQPVMDVVPMPAVRQPVQTGAYAYVAGWGLEKEMGKSSPDLRAVSVPIVDPKQCGAWFKGRIVDGMLCAGYEKGGKDSCQDDSGGPLTVDGVLVGIVSWGIGCARPKQPGVYARVAYFRDWIDAELKKGPARKTSTPPPRRGRWNWRPFY